MAVAQEVPQIINSAGMPLLKFIANSFACIFWCIFHGTTHSRGISTDLLQPGSDLLLQEGSIPCKGARQGGSAEDPRAVQSTHQEGHALLPLAVWGCCCGGRRCQPRSQPCTRCLHFRLKQLHEAMHSRQ